MNGTITIYHNPACGTSRNVLALLRAAGVEPVVIEYLRTPPDRGTLATLIAAMGMTVRDVVRTRGIPAADAARVTDDLDDEELLARMVAHPILINRPIVVSPAGVRLCRPSDLVAALLPQPPAHDLRKQDGSPVLIGTPVDGGDTGMRAALAEADLPIADLALPGRQFFAYSTLSGVTVGYAGMELYGRHVLLRSLVTSPSMRGKGVGGGMLGLLLRRAFDQGAREAWLLTTTAAPWFERHGFRTSERSDAPAAILDTQEARLLCAASAVLLWRGIEL